MLQKVYQKAYELKSKLNSILPLISDNISEEEVKKFWVDYTPKEIPVFAISEDGSLNKKFYLGFYLFSVAGYAYGQNLKQEEFEFSTAEVGISVIKSSEKVDNYFRLLMFLCELKSILSLAKQVKPELLILDGTLSSKFIVSAPKTNWFTKEEFSGQLAELAGSLIKDIKPIIYKYDIASFSDEITSKVVKLIPEKLGIKAKRDILEAILSKLAYFEYFLLLYELFYELNWNPHIIGIGKTSTDTQIFNSSVPDMRIFYKYTTTNGYSKPRYVSMENKAKTQEWEFSEVFEKYEKEKANALKDVSIQYFYTRYKNTRNVYLIEAYENPSKETINPEQVMDYLAYLSPSGYPFYLIKADADVRITKNDMDLIEDILSLKYELTGRESLI